MIDRLYEFFVLNSLVMIELKIGTSILDAVLKQIYHAKIGNSLIIYPIYYISKCWVRKNSGVSLRIFWDIFILILFFSLYNFQVKIFNIYHFKSVLEC